jgi:hypothetical protein
MKYIITKCPFCPKELREDSEELYWHIKIHNATTEGIKQPELLCTCNMAKMSTAGNFCEKHKIQTFY